MSALAWIDAAVLAVHLVSAVLFVGGSLFFWLVVEPASYALGLDEAARTAVIGRLARRFGRITTPLLVILVGTGLYNASWYLPSVGALTTTVPGEVLLAKSVVVAGLIVLIYVHGAYYGPRIVRLARERRYDELRALRRRSRAVSFANLALMLVVLVLAVVLQSVG